jgi:hypothetical protein
VASASPPTDLVTEAVAANALLGSIKTDVDKIPSKGSSTMSGSTPVTLATDGPGVANLQALAAAHPYYLANCTASTTTTTDVAKLKSGGVYDLRVQTPDTDEITPVSCRIAFNASAGTAATSSNLKQRSYDGPLRIVPVVDLYVNLLRIGSVDVAVQITGLTSTSTVAVS